MLPRVHALKLVGTLAATAFLVLAVGAAAGGKPGKPETKPGLGKGRVKVTLCHKGHTIRVGFPAVRAHVRHGDTFGRCGTHPAPHTATLAVIKHVVNDNGGTKTAADFTLTINGVTAAGGNSFAGSEAGVAKAITSFGSYSVSEAPVAGYAGSASAGCSGTIAAGEQRICILTNDDQAATLTVVKHVINDHVGTKVAADFTLTINGVVAVGGNSFAGAESPGVTKTLTSVGAYSVTEAPAAGYAASASAGCSGTIALGESRTCTITNDDL
jgi:Prealbumin-like fold domain